MKSAIWQRSTWSNRISFLFSTASGPSQPVAWSIKMARRKDSEKATSNNDDTESNPNDEMEEEPNFDDPEGYVDDISEQGV